MNLLETMNIEKNLNGNEEKQKLSPDLEKIYQEKIGSLQKERKNQQDTIQKRDTTISQCVETMASQQRQIEKKEQKQTDLERKIIQLNHRIEELEKEVIRSQWKSKRIADLEDEVARLKEPEDTWWDKVKEKLKPKPKYSCYGSSHWWDGAGKKLLDILLGTGFAIAVFWGVYKFMTSI